MIATLIGFVLIAWLLSLGATREDKEYWDKFWKRQNRWLWPLNIVLILLFISGFIWHS